MAMMRMRQAVMKALDDALREDPTVIMMGEDIAAAGGPFKVTEGLLEIHGPQRVIDTPISEMAFMGAAVGAAVCGMKPVVERFHVRFGGIVTRTYYRNAREFEATPKNSLPVIVRWPAYADPQSPLLTFDALDRSRSIEDALHALALYPGPTQNFVVADTSGRAAYQLAGDPADHALGGRRILVDRSELVRGHAVVGGIVAIEQVMRRLAPG